MCMLLQCWIPCGLHPAPHLCLLHPQLPERVDQLLLQHGQAEVDKQQQRVVTRRLLPERHLRLSLEDERGAVLQGAARRGQQ